MFWSTQLYGGHYRILGIRNDTRGLYEPSKSTYIIGARYSPEGRFVFKCINCSKVALIVLKRLIRLQTAGWHKSSWFQSIFWEIEKNLDQNIIYIKTKHVAYNLNKGNLV